MFVFCVAWTLGGMLETPSRKILDAHFRTIDETVMPVCEEGDTIYECRVSEQTCEWEKWTPPVWTYPQLEEDQHLDFSNLLVPTMDTTRSLYIVETMTKQCLDVLMVGGPGTAKTSTGLLYFSSLDASVMSSQLVNFSSATTMRMFQDNIESGLDKRGGKSFGPPNGMKRTIFMDDLSMPLVNDWGDQVREEKRGEKEHAVCCCLCVVRCALCAVCCVAMFTMRCVLYAVCCVALLTMFCVLCAVLYVLRPPPYASPFSLSLSLSLLPQGGGDG